MTRPGAKGGGAGADAGAQKQVEERRLRPIYGELLHDLGWRLSGP